jgi:UDP-glucose 4-epimerase
MVESSAAVYGDTTVPVIDERAPVCPVSPYAYSKYAVERMLRDIAAVYQLQIVCFRLFNVVGLGDGRPYRRSAPDVLSQLQNAIEGGKPFRIHGTDWPTVDGTTLRDFVHVQDVVRAHLSLMTAPVWPLADFDILNLATGTGTTVRQLVELYQSLHKVQVRVEETGRRPGDIAGFVGDPRRAGRLLSWSAQLNVSDAIATRPGRDSAQRALLRAVTSTPDLTG